MDSKKKNLYSSGQFAEKAGVSLRTIRYYDKKNILKPSYRTESGARYYSDQDFTRLQQILLWKYLGFSLDEIREMTLAANEKGALLGSLGIQKKLVEEMKDMKVKFLYITTADQKSSAEKWMTENNIKGEHVYITRNEWKQFETMINFTAIPRGALVSKEGKLIEQDFEIHQFNSEELKKLAERF